MSGKGFWARGGKRGGGKPPAKGQRSLASFGFQRTNQETPSIEPRPPAAKKQRTDAGARPAPPATSHLPPPPRPARTGPGDIPSRDPILHHQAQNKLVGEWEQRQAERAAGAAGMPAGAAGAVSPRGTGAPKFTPLEQQIVALKRANPGVLLCVEVGYKFKFYGEDAEAAREVLHIFAYPDHNFLVASVPVPRIHVHVRRLVEAGYKVGLVRQTETAALKAAGDNKTGPFSRGITAVITRATLQAGALAGLEEEASAAESGAPSALWSSERLSSYLTCVVEEPVAGPAGAGGAVELGLVAVEPSTGDVLYAQFRDGMLRSELEGELRFLSPAELLLAEPLSEPTHRLLAAFGSGGVVQASKAAAAAAASQTSRRLRPSGEVRVERVPAAKYRQGGALAAVTGALAAGGGSSGSGAGGADNPGSGTRAAAAAAGEEGAVEVTGGPSDEALDAVMRLPPLVLRGLAHALDYLRPLGVDAVLRQAASFRPLSTVRELALSANALEQLEVLRSSAPAASSGAAGGERGSLLWLMDRTLTTFGGRLLRSWCSRPLRQRAAIEERLEAVEELLQQGDSHPVLSRLPAMLRSLPDLQRSLTRALHRTAAPSEFLSLLRICASLHEALGLHADLAAEPLPPASSAGQGSGGEDAASEQEEVAQAVPQVAVPGVRSPLLRGLLAAAGDLRVAATARDTLAAMDEEAARTNDKLHLLVDDEQRCPEVVALRRQLKAHEQRLESLLPELARALNVRTLQYVTLQNQGSHLVEVPVELAARVPRDWEKVSSTKKAVRFHPPQVKAALQALELTREQLAAACQAAWLDLLGRFGCSYAAFRAAVQALAALDCLNSLAGLAASPGYCRPTLVDDDEAPPQLHIVGGRHPVLDATMEGRFVPNDTHLQGGEGQQCCAIVTGPNMGGKSCYIRQAALIAIMAQVGSFVPAESVTMHVFDGIFTRMGASENLALGRSTFAEELSEASAILAGATPRSLVIMDELGRGTSTRDGVAIAAATLAHLAHNLRPLCLFVTHYPEVARLHEELPEVGAYYMSYLQQGGRPEALPALAASSGQAGGEGGNAAQGQQAQQGQQGEKPAEAAGPEQQPAGAAAVPAQQGGDAAEYEEPRITFLYKLTPGVAPASFGLNVARMAGLPASVCARAAERVRAAAAEAAAAAAAKQAEGLGEQENRSSGQQAVAEAGRGVLQKLTQAAQGGGGLTAAAIELQAEARQVLKACSD